MASDTSSDLNIELLNNKDGVQPIKKETTETDLYLGLAANPSKVLADTPRSSSSLHYNNDNEDSITSHSNKKSDSSESSNTFKNIKTTNKSSKNLSDSSSKAKYEKVTISPQTNSKFTEVKPEPVLTPQQIRMKRIELLRKLSDIKSKGFKLSKEYDFNSSIEEMEYEYDLLKSFAERRNGIKLYKNTILNVSNILEFFNNKYDPFGIKLDGWSEHMNVEIDSYDDVMEELYEKYKSSGKSMPPELKLFMLVVASASAFHFSKSYLTKMPGMDGIMNMQPDFISKIVTNAPPQFMTEQELNIETQRKEMQEKNKQMKQQMKQPQQQQFQQSQQQFQQPQPQFQQPQPQFQQPRQQFQQPQPQFQQQFQQSNESNQSSKQNIIKPPQAENFQSFHKSVNFSTPLGTPSQIIPSNDPRNILQNKTIIKSSESVKDILSRLHNREVDTVDTQDETSSINNDRLVSDTLSDSGSKTKKKKKSMMKIF